MRISIGVALALAIMAALLAGSAFSAEPETGGMFLPQYDAEGALLRPTGYETWVLVGTSIGLGYSKESNREGPGRFHNVYLQPEAYRHYLRTGQFPEKTVLAMAVYEPAQKVSINRRGYFAGEFVSLEVALKDHERFPEGWAYFDFGKSGPKSTPFPKARCYSCHNEHGADDNVFVQFYSLLRDVKKGDK